MVGYDADVVHALRELAVRASQIAGVICVSAWLSERTDSSWRLLASVSAVSGDGTNRSDGPAVLRGQRFATLLDKAHTRRRAVLKRQAACPADPSAEQWCYAVPIGPAALSCIVTIEAVGREDRLRALTPTVAANRSAIEDAIIRLRSKDASPSADKQSLDTWLSELGAQSDEVAAAKRLIEASVAIASADTASVMLTDSEGKLRIAADRGLEAGVVASTRVAVGEGIAGWVLATGSPVAVDDLVHSAAGRRHGITSAMSIPLSSGGRLVGVLNVGTRSQRSEWRREVAWPLDALARAAAATIVAIRGRTAEPRRACLPTTEEIVLRRIDARRSDTWQSSG